MKPIPAVIGLLASLGFIGVGLGWYIHPAIGLVVVGGLVWIDFTVKGLRQ